MSDGIEVSVSSLQKVFSILRTLVPKGDITTPVGFHVRDSVLKIICIQGCVYQATVDIENTEAIGNATVMFRDISPLLPNTGVLELSFQSTYLTVSGEGFSADFPAAFSVVEPYTFKNLTYKELSSSVFQSGFKTLTGIGLEKLYNKISPVAIWDSIALQKFPNVWVQVRANGLPISAVIDMMHIQLLMRFDPQQVSIAEANTLVFKNNNAVLQIPCKPINEKSSITDMLKDMRSISKFTIGSYMERLRSVIKFGSKEFCKIALHESGISTTVSHSNATVSITTGNIETRVESVFELPIQLWLTLLRGIGSESVEILYGGGKVCLRTPFTIIVTHVLR